MVLSSIEARFLGSLKRFWPEGPLPLKIAVSLSGGVDSMCLVHLLHRVNKVRKLNISIYPISMDHGLRKESADEMTFIQREMSKLDLNENFQACKLDLSSIKDKPDASFEELARIKRSEKLHEICNQLNIRHIFTGHHADDDLETFVLRLLGNSGEFGLRGISRISYAPYLSFPYYTPNPLQLVRPLLDFTKDELYQYAKENNINWVEDHTNNQMVAKRNIIRKYLKDNPEKTKQLRHTQSEVIKFTDDMEEQVNNVYRRLFKTNKIKTIFNRVEININNQILESYPDIVIARLLFKIAYPYSPMLHYHYRLATFMDQIPKLRKAQTFTCMSLVWRFKKIKTKVDKKVWTDLGVKVIFQRESPKESKFFQTTKVPARSESDWVLFDNIYWLKFRNPSDETKSFTMSKVTKHDIYTYPIFLKKEYENLPLYHTNDQQFNENNLPTVFPKLSIYWKLKPNIYEFNESQIKGVNDMNNDINDHTITGASSSSSSRIPVK